MFPLLNAIGWSAACAGASLALLGLFHRRERNRRQPWASLADNSFGIFLFHAPLAMWGQYALLPLPWSGGLKALAVFAASLGLGWAMSAALRRVPGVRRFM